MKTRFLHPGKINNVGHQLSQMNKQYNSINSSVEVI